MKIEEVQALIEKCILAGRQIVIDYTNSQGISDQYLILAITSTWDGSFVTKAKSLSGRPPKPFYRFRYDRVSAVDITDELYEPHDHLVAKMRDGSLFSSTDNRIYRRGGLKGYPSSLNYISEVSQRLTGPEAQDLINEINIPPLDDWLRGLVLKIEDGDTYDILLETDVRGSYVTRLFGVDAPEYKKGSTDFVLGLEAKVFVEDMFKESRYCYVKKLGIDTFDRHLMHVYNAAKQNVAIELLEAGLGFPMMAYFDEDLNARTKYEAASRKAYESTKGLWAIEGIRDRYSNIMSETAKTTINPLEDIPNKESIIDKYLKQSPKSKIILKAFDRKEKNESNSSAAENIFMIITQRIQTDGYDLDSYKEMCDLYLAEIQRVEELSNNPEFLKDCILYIEDKVSKLNLGDGAIKGNFSKGRVKLLYHEDPESRWYQLCTPEIRFRTVRDARYCGFRPHRSKARP